MKRKNQMGLEKNEEYKILLEIKRKIDNFYKEREIIDIVDEQDLIAEIHDFLKENIPKAYQVADEL